MSCSSPLQKLASGFAVAFVVAGCGGNPVGPELESARVLGVTVLASVDPEIPASMGQTLSGGVPVKITFETSLDDATELKVYVCLSEAENPLLNASCVSRSRPAAEWQSPYIMGTSSAGLTPGRTYTFRFVHVFLMRGTDPIPGMGQLPSQYFDKRTESILIFTVP